MRLPRRRSWCTATPRAVDAEGIERAADEYRRLLDALRDDRLDLDARGCRRQRSPRARPRSSAPRRGRMTDERSSSRRSSTSRPPWSSVPIAKRLGPRLGPRLPARRRRDRARSVLGLVGDEGTDVMHFAEFGVVMMLFLVGLELEPALLWRLRGPILGLGGLQVAATAAVVAGAGARARASPGSRRSRSGSSSRCRRRRSCCSRSPRRACSKTAAGQSSFAVLLFQDIAVIPILARLPAARDARAAAHGSRRTARPWVARPARLAHGARRARRGRRRSSRSARFVVRAGVPRDRRARGCASRSPRRRCCS